MIFDILDNFVYPEVMRRVEKGLPSQNFRLYNVHFAEYADQTKNKILLNDKVRSVAHTKFKQGKKYHKGQPIVQVDVKDYSRLYPSESNDKNSSRCDIN